MRLDHYSPGEDARAPSQGGQLPIGDSLYALIFPGDHGEGETPVPIPNTEVKPLSGDGTVGLAMGE